MNIENWDEWLEEARKRGWESVVDIGLAQEVALAIRDGQVTISNEKDIYYEDKFVLCDGVSEDDLSRKLWAHCKDGRIRMCLLGAQLVDSVLEKEQICPI